MTKIANSKDRDRMLAVPRVLANLPLVENDLFRIERHVSNRCVSFSKLDFQVVVFEANDPIVNTTSLVRWLSLAAHLIDLLKLQWFWTPKPARKPTCSRRHNIYRELTLNCARTFVPKPRCNSDTSPWVADHNAARDMFFGTGIPHVSNEDVPS